jgi:hypothetical protein
MCTVLGNPHTYDGTGWRFQLSGDINQVSDGAGLLPFDHGGGSTPLTWRVCARNQGNDTLNVFMGVLAFSENATQLTARAIRNDTHDYFVNNPVHFSWEADF